MAPRTRSKAEGLISGTAQYRNWYPNGTLASSGTHVLTCTKKRLEVTTQDTVVPNFHRRRANGEIFNNGFSTRKEVRDGTGMFHTEVYCDTQTSPIIPYGQLQAENDGSGDFYLYRWVQNNTESPPSTSGLAALSALQAVSRNNALASINQTEFNLPLFAVEWSKTLGLYRQISDVFYDEMKRAWDILRGNRAYLPATLRNLSHAWLFARFGVTPLLYELQGAAKVLSQPLPERQTARGQAYDVIEASKTFYVSDGLIPDPSSYQMKWDRVINLKVRNGVLYESQYTGLNKAASLGLTRPATVAWEAIPFSFVIDRFVDIGTWLDAIQPAGTYETLAAWESVEKVVSDHIYTTGAVTRSGLYGTRTRDCKYEIDYYEVITDKTRVPWNAQPSFPVWRPFFNLKHALDYVALLNQRLKGLR